jgi:O-succinylbenzoic acid--CoA ligase
VNIPPGKSKEVPREHSFQVMDGVKAELDERGCLVVDIPGVTGGPVVSNDLAEITGPRSFRWLGRLDNVIKTGGIKVIPETIEVVVKELTGWEAVVLPVPDPRLGQKLLLVLEGTGKEPASAGSSELQERDHITEALKDRLAAHEVPKEIRVLTEFPRNRSMKIDRKEIRKLLDLD